MKLFRIYCLCTLIALVSAVQVIAQTKAQKKAEVQQLVESQRFVFSAESANPMSGGNIRLTSTYYEVRFMKDSLSSFLPYFGTAFRAPYGASDSPLRFTSSDFSYDAVPGKKGGYTVSLKINKPDDPNRLILTVSSSGYATLQVSSVNRQPISFYGTILPLNQHER